MAHFARRGEAPRVVSIAPHAPAPAKNAVQPPRQSNREPTRTARERQLVGRLDEQMHVIGLHREMDQAKSIARAQRERAAKLEKQGLLAQTRERPRRAQREMDRVTLFVLGASNVRNRGARA